MAIAARPNGGHQMLAPLGDRLCVGQCTRQCDQRTPRWTGFIATIPFRSGKFVMAVKCDIVHKRAFGQWPEFIGMNHKLRTTSDPAIFSGSGGQRGRSLKTLLIRRVFLDTEIQGELISCWIDPNAEAMAFAAAVRIILQPPTVNCRVIEKPIGQLQAVFVEDHQKPLLPVWRGLGGPITVKRPFESPFLRLLWLRRSSEADCR